ncbi:MAG TPA: hypothetical protein DCY97_04650 [Marinilabiliales bacterium]|nr:hypothetical protein [Marinilabiliales bacterium]
MNKLYFFAIILVLTFLTSGAIAQTSSIHGTVYHAETRQPIRGVKVSVKNLGLSTVTDENGNFNFVVPVKGLLDFEDFENMNLTEIRIIGKDTYYLYLQEKIDVAVLSIEELLDMQVFTASKKAEKIKDIPASIIILSKTDIEKAGFTSLEEIFQHLPGMYYVDNASFLGPTVGVRGYLTSSPTNLMILINGIPQHDDLFNTFSFHISPIPVESIDRIEFVRGAMSVIYGTNAFFGAINIITNEAPTDKDFGVSQVSLGYGTLNSMQAAITSKGKSGAMSYALAAQIKSSDGIDEPFQKMVTDFGSKYSGWGILDSMATSKDYFAMNQKYLNFSAKYRNLYFDINVAGSRFGQTFGVLFYQPTECKLFYGKSTIGLRKPFQNHLTLDAKLMLTRFDLLMGDNYYSTDTSGFGNEPDIYSYGQYWSERIDGELNVFYEPNNTWNFKGGLVAGTIYDAGDKTDAPFNGAVNLLNRAGGLKKGDKVNLLSGYGQLEYQPLPTVRAIVGARVEQMGPFELVLHRASYYPGHEKFTNYHPKSDFYVVPRIACIYNPSKDHVFKALYSQAIKMPDIWQMRNNIISREVLKPEKIGTFELNYLAKWSKTFNSNISLFRNSLNDIIVRSIVIDNSATPAVYTSSFSNQGRINTTGVEWSIQTQPVPKLSIDFSATWQQSKNTHGTDGTIPVEFSPEWLCYLRAQYQMNSHVAVSLTANYVDDMYAQYDPNPINPSMGDFTPIGWYGKKVDGYVLLGSSLSIDNLPAGSYHSYYFRFRLSNLLDSEIHYPSTSVSKWADKGVLGTGRGGHITVGLKFK